MFTKQLGKHNLSVEIRNGVGIDLEFPDARPIWVQNNLTNTGEYMCFEGIIILLPFLVVSLGKVFEADE